MFVITDAGAERCYYYFNYYLATRSDRYSLKRTLHMGCGGSEVLLLFYVNYYLATRSNGYSLKRTLHMGCGGREVLLLFLLLSSN